MEAYKVIFVGLEGYVDIRRFGGDTTTPENLRFTPANDPETIIIKVGKLGQDYNIGWGLATRKSPGDGTKSNLKQIQVLWLDVDAHGDTVTPEDKLKQAKDALRDLGLIPGMIVFTGRGYHIYIRIQKLDFEENPDGLRRVEQALAGLIRVAGSDGSRKDASSIMRIPGTMNINANPPVQCRVAELNPDAPIYSLDEILAKVAGSGELEKTSAHSDQPHGFDPQISDRYSTRPCLLDALERCGEGNRNETLCFYADALKKDGLSLDDALERAGKVFGAKGLSTTEITATINSIYGGNYDYSPTKLGYDCNACVDKASCPTYKHILEKKSRYKLDDKGLQFYNDKDETWTTVSSCRVMIEKVLVNHNTGKHSYSLAFQTTTGKVVFDVDGEVLGSLSEFKKTLASHGIITSPLKNNLEAQHLLAYLKESQEYARKVFLISQLGFHEIEGKWFYVMPNEIISVEKLPVNLEVYPSLFSGLADIMSGVTQQGSRREYYLGIKEYIRKCPGVAVAIGVVLASVICQFLKNNGINFLFHFAGTAYTGKTSSVRMGISALANPNIYLLSWNDTANFFERAAFLTNPLPLFFDDFKTSHDKETMERITHMLASGTARGRATRDGGIQEIRRWTNLVLSTGEDFLAQPGFRAGTYSRVIEITPPFAPVGFNWKEANNFADNHHGFAARDLVMRILKKISREGAEKTRADILAIQEAFIDKIKGWFVEQGWG
ncbi:MAG: DUF927 domain-containing protein, partial [candidate division WOR-3 bacterium]